MTLHNLPVSAKYIFFLSLFIQGRVMVSLMLKDHETFKKTTTLYQHVHIVTPGDIFTNEQSCLTAS